MKVTDLIVDILEDYGVEHVFMVVGGGSMHLNDSIGKSKLKYICMHHEQGCAIAAEGYAKASGKLAVVCVTTCPGSTNTLTGVIGAWVDSVPMLIISGQVRQKWIAKPPLRQLGDQEGDIISMVNPITKYCKRITKPSMTKQVMDRAIKMATTGRKAPVWVEVPMDIQEANV